MPMSSSLTGFFLFETCLYVCGAPTPLPGLHFLSSCDGQCATSMATAGLVQHMAGGGTGPHGQPAGTESVTQAENEGTVGGKFGPPEMGEEAQVKEAESLSEAEDAQSKKEDDSSDRQQEDMAAFKLTSGSFSASSVAQAQLDDSYIQQSKQDEAERFQRSDIDSVTSSASFLEPQNVGVWTQKLASLSPIPHMMLRTTSSSPLDPILPEVGPSNMIPRDEVLESLWTETARPEDPAPSQDEAADATMSSEALPLIFEPFEEVTAERAAAAVAWTPGGALTPAAMTTRWRPPSEVSLERLGPADAPSRLPPVPTADWTASWQTSGAELLESVSSSASQPLARTEPANDSGTDADTTSNFKDRIPSAGPSVSSLQHDYTVTMETHQFLHQLRSGVDGMESEEEADEDEDEENSEESIEDESEEEQTEEPKSFSSQSPYSLIPPPPVWLQRNQGLMRSWVELIREKAGYVSGMLAPVGIGITGALLIVGALYSIRMIHRKRRNSFKHQRRKPRQPEQPCEPGISCQDQTMLLADSSEDEF